MKDLRKAVKSWANKIGYREAVVRLITRGVSPRAAERLCSGDYTSEPKSLRYLIIDELSKDNALATTAGNSP